MATILTADPERMSTGAPLPPPAWQMICEFANGSCVCARTRADGPPCYAIEIVERRIKNRILHDLAAAERARRKGG